MKGPMLCLRTIVERDPGALTVRVRPAQGQPAGIAAFVPVPDRLWTYEVKAGPPNQTACIGFTRWSLDDGTWITKTPGNTKRDVTIRAFPDHHKAALWLRGLATDRARRKKQKRGQS